MKAANLKKQCISSLSKSEVLERMGADPKGLSGSEIRKRQEAFGFNELQEAGKKSVVSVFAEQWKDFLVMILVGAAVISALLGDWESSLVIFFVIMMNAVLGTVQQVKAEQSLNSLKQLSAPSAKVLRADAVQVIPSREVVPGDIVLLEAGDYVCADGRILENASMKVNESALTGESLSVEKEDCRIEGEVPLGDRKNMVFSGSFVTYGRGKFVVTRTGMDTEVGKIASLLKNTSESKTPLQVNLDRFGRKLSILILVICGILFALSVIRGEKIIDAFLFAVALAVAAIPEALSSIVTIVLAFGTKKMVREHVIIRKLQAVEGLGSVSVICSDKTGTLTQNKMTVLKYYAAGRVTDCSCPDGHIENDGHLSGCVPDGAEKEHTRPDCVPDDSEKGHVLPDPLAEKLIDFGVLCSDAKEENGTEIGDPTELALIHLAERYGKDSNGLRKKIPRLGEIPFDSERKLMSTVHNYRGEQILITKGAVDVLCGRLDAVETSAGVVPVTPEHLRQIQEMNLAFSRDGLRVLAFAYRILPGGGQSAYAGNEERSFARNVTPADEAHFTFVGLMAMMDPPREESREAVEKCIRAGIRPVMITGDHKITAAAVAKQIGILEREEEAVEGSVLNGMTDEEVAEFVEHVSVYARVTPEHKIRIVRAWQEKGNIVAMTGDGVNDAPALKQADVGVAMGITGSEVAKDAASMVLTDDNFASIVKAVENGRNVYANIKKSIQFLLSGNMAGILSVLYASIAGLAVPFAAVHLLFINLLTDSLPAIALGLDPHSDRVMREKPRPKNESILTGDFLKSIGIEGFVIAVMTMAAYHIGLAKGGASMASTMAFATLCLSRLVHGFNSKSKEPVLFKKEFFNNKYLIGAFLAGFALLNLVLLVPALGSVFQTEPLSAGMLFTVYGLSAANLPVIQAVKKIRMKHREGI